MKAHRRAVLAGTVSVAMLWSIAGCKQSSSPESTNTSNDQGTQQASGQDPASANLAPVSNTTDNTGALPSDDQSAPASSDADNSQNYGDQNYDNYETPDDYAPQPPPELPDYQQPPCPGDNYIWTPGYWYYSSNAGYYWVPGAWVVAPFAGALWTPGWWGYSNGRYAWRHGFWGRHVGYYGGINYGYGYGGYGYQGGYWRNNQFAYNREVNNVDPSRVHDVYSYRYRAPNNTRVSYNGGSGGVRVLPRPAEMAALHEGHVAPMTSQVQLRRQASSNQQNFARVSHGRPAEAAVAHPLMADKNVRAPEVRNPGPAARPEQRPGQPRNVPPPQPGHPVTNAGHAPAAPHAAEHSAAREHTAARPAGEHPATNRQPQTSSRPQQEHGSARVPARAVGPEPAARRQGVENRPAQPAPKRSAAQPRPAQPAHRPAPQRAEPKPSHPAPRPHPQTEQKKPAPDHKKPEPDHKKPE